MIFCPTFLVLVQCNSVANVMDEDNGFSVTKFTIFSNPIIHLVYPSKFCVFIVCNFSWDMKMSHEKLKPVPLQDFGQ